MTGILINKAKFMADVNQSFGDYITDQINSFFDPTTSDACNTRSNDFYNK